MPLPDSPACGAGGGGGSPSPAPAAGGSPSPAAAAGGSPKPGHGAGARAAVPPAGSPHVLGKHMHPFRRPVLKHLLRHAAP